nr:hypothetical protein [Rhodonellum psychrophilum]
MNHFRKIISLFSHFCLVLILSVIANGMLFFHSHELDNGKIITHAHPILTEEQENLPDHGHTESELIILDLIAHADYFVFEYQFHLPENPVFETTVSSGYYFKNSYQKSLIGFEHRGPPANA